MTQKRWNSPIVWAATLGVLLTQVKMMQETGFTTVNVVVALITVAIAFLGALNNPENKEGF